MPFSYTAGVFNEAVKASDLPLREIADRLGLRHLDTLEDMRSGKIRIHFPDIPMIARTLGIDERKFVLGAIEEYYPGVMGDLLDAIGIQKPDAEVGLLAMFRMMGLRDRPEAASAFLRSFDALLDLTRQIDF